MSSFVLRDGFTPSNIPRYEQAAKAWTGYGYESVQSCLRNGGTNARLHCNHLAKFFQRLPTRAPKGSGSTYVLYRGVTNPTSETFRRSGFIHELGYLAFSGNKDIAKSFGGLVFRLYVKDVEKGTPWLWFNKSIGSHVPTEEEVLLPPGRLLALPRDPLDPDVFPVCYRRFR